MELSNRAGENNDTPETVVQAELLDFTSTGDELLDEKASQWSQEKRIIMAEKLENWAKLLRESAAPSNVPMLKLAPKPPKKKPYHHNNKGKEGWLVLLLGKDLERELKIMAQCAETPFLTFVRQLLCHLANDFSETVGCDRRGKLYKLNEKQVGSLVAKSKMVNKVMRWKHSHYRN